MSTGVMVVRAAAVVAVAVVGEGAARGDIPAFLRLAAHRAPVVDELTGEFAPVTAEIGEASGEHIADGGAQRDEEPDEGFNDRRDGMERGDEDQREALRELPNHWQQEGQQSAREPGDGFDRVAQCLAQRLEGGPERQGD
jgi:hypothetical protein